MRPLVLAAAPLAPSTPRTRPRSLSPSGRHSPHLQSRPQDRSRRLVREDHSRYAMEFPCPTFYLPGFLGCLRAHSARVPGIGNSRRRSFGVGAKALARSVEGTTTGGASSAGV